MTGSTFDRRRALARMADDEFDVLVIGGGITGAGVALDAAARGLRIALVERRDFASGTSSKSSKLVHGGLRYLQQKEFRLVYEALAERQRLLRNAPHLVHILPFLIPLFGKEGMVNQSVAKAMSTALWMYDATGGARIGKLHERISLEQAKSHMPTLRHDRLIAGWLYYDARTDDARLTLAVLRTAVLDHGAVAANDSAVTALLHDSEGRARGARLADGTEVRAAVVVNATGVWSDAVAPGGPEIRPAKGVHITVPWEKVRNDIAAVVPVPRDRRSIFVVPWGDRVYIGTTDTDYQGPLDDPVCTAEDVQYLLRAMNASMDETLTEADVLGTWAGLRPLVARAKSDRTADLSRRHAVLRSDGGVITVTGGKLTTYRKMAADTIDEVVSEIGRGARRSPTKKLRLRGAGDLASLQDDRAAARFGVDHRLLGHLVGRYGSEARVLLAMVESDQSLREPLVPTLPYIRAEAVFATRYEMAQSLEDVLDRRTRARILAAEETTAAAGDVARLIAPELGWDDDEAASRAAAYSAAVQAERGEAGLPEALGALA